MSAGIADAGMRALGRDRPTQLPVQALDHATALGAVCRAAGQLGSGLVKGLGEGRAPA